MPGAKPRLRLGDESQANEAERKTGIAPIIPHNVRLLILGSLPGDASLAAQRYYAHPRNRFWRLLGNVLGHDLVALAYEARLPVLATVRIGLWDVVASAQRRGSLDTAMRAVTANPLAECIDGLADLRAVAFNGATAAKIGRRALAGRAGLALIDLPSSSPAHAAMSVAEKAARWAELATFLDIETPLAAIPPHR